MLILNPLYDWAFKYLLDNNELARKFVSAILCRNVTHLETRNIELPLLKEGNPFYTRFDFKAIVEADGRTEEVLIELQKYRSPDPVGRFRTYLGESYMREESYTEADGTRKRASLPLIAVYILGYSPAEFRVPHVVARPVLYDGIDGTVLEMESRTVGLLTHTSHFLLAVPPAGYVWRGSRQEAVLRLFRQKLDSEESNTIYELEDEPQDEVARELAAYLNLGTRQEDIVRRLKAEEEYYASLVELEAALEESRRREEELARRESEASRREAEERRQREESERREAEASRREAEERRQREESERREAEASKREAEERRQREESERREADSRRRMVEVARMLKGMGVPEEEISRTTGLAPEELAGL